MAKFLIAIVLVQSLILSWAAEWSYDDQNAWPSNYCKGHSQSPIDINPGATKVKNLVKFNFNSWTREKREAAITNNGHTVNVKFTDNKTASAVSGGELLSEYVLDAFHFHWGSEHTVNGKRYDLESHFVYFAKKYGNFANALKAKDGVAVLAILYQVGPRSNPVFDFANEVPSIAHKLNQPHSLRNPIVVGNFYNVDDGFYRYQGSLTTPNCDEVVTWTVFATPSYISQDQLKNLKAIFDDHDQPLTRNYRNIQALNGRTVTYYKA